MNAQNTDALVIDEQGNLNVNGILKMNKLHIDMRGQQINNASAVNMSNGGTISNLAKLSLLNGVDISGSQVSNVSAINMSKGGTISNLRLLKMNGGGIDMTGQEINNVSAVKMINGGSITNLARLSITNEIDMAGHQINNALEVNMINGGTINNLAKLAVISEIAMAKNSSISGVGAIAFETIGLNLSQNTLTTNPSSAAAFNIQNTSIPFKLAYTYTRLKNTDNRNNQVVFLNSPNNTVNFSLWGGARHHLRSGIRFFR